MKTSVIFYWYSSLTSFSSDEKDQKSRWRRSFRSHQRLGHCVFWNSLLRHSNTRNHGRSRRRMAGEMVFEVWLLKKHLFYNTPLRPLTEHWTADEILRLHPAFAGFRSGWQWPQPIRSAENTTASNIVSLLQPTNEVKNSQLFAVPTCRNKFLRIFRSELLLQ
mgnify:CR=1 FL=1